MHSAQYNFHAYFNITIPNSHFKQSDLDESIINREQILI